MFDFSRGGGYNITMRNYKATICSRDELPTHKVPIDKLEAFKFIEESGGATHYLSAETDEAAYLLACGMFFLDDLCLDGSIFVVVRDEN